MMLLGHNIFIATEGEANEDAHTHPVLQTSWLH
jgi:hypothetical protein